MEGLLELRRQGVFRWGWTREQGVIKSLQAIGRFGNASDEEAQAVFSQAVSTNGGALTQHYRDMAGFERQKKEIGGKKHAYWRVRGARKMASRDRLAQLEGELSDRHRRTRLASVIAFRTDGDATEFYTAFLLEEFIRLDMPGLLQRYGDFLRVPAASATARMTARSIRHNETFYILTGNLIELLSCGIINVTGLNAALSVTLQPATFAMDWPSDCSVVGPTAEPALKPQPKQQFAVEKTPTKFSSYAVHGGKRRISPPMMLYIAGQVEICTKQTRMMESLRHAAKFFGCELADEGVSERTISRVHGMAGVLAMAYTTAGLVAAGHFEETRSLMCDGATVRAGLHVQGMISSECVRQEDGGDESSVFNESFLGFQMLQNGTDEHRIDRCEMIFAELVKCLKHFPQFLPEQCREPQFLEALDKGDVTAPFQRMLGDHGENGVLSGLANRIEMGRIDERGFFFQEGGKEVEVRVVKRILLFFCHFHKVLNVYDICRGAMCQVEGTDATEHDLEADPEVDKDLAKDFPDMLGLLGKRRQGTPLASSVVNAVCKLAGNFDHESLNKEKQMKALRDAEGADRLYWANARNARGSQAEYENSGNTFILLLSPGALGVEYLIDALAAKQGKYGQLKANRMHQLISTLRVMPMVWAQLGCELFMHVCLLGPYRALTSSTSTTQLQMVPVLKELYDTMHLLHDTPAPLHMLAYIDEDGATIPTGAAQDVPRTRVVRYDVREVHVSQRLRQQMNYILFPPATWMSTAQRSEYHQAQQVVLRAMAAAALKKIEALTDAKYGVGGVGLFDLDMDDPIIRGLLETTQSASLAIERAMAKLDRYMREFYSATPFSLNAAMLAQDVGISNIMHTQYQEDPDEAASMMYDAMDFQEELRCDWRATAAADAQADSADAHSLYAKRAARLQANEAKLTAAKSLDDSWRFESEQQVREQVGKLSSATARKDWLVERLRVYLLVHDMANDPDENIVRQFYPKLRRDADGTVKKGQLCIKGKRTEEELITMLVACGTLIEQRRSTLAAPTETPSDMAMSPTTTDCVQDCLARRRPKRKGAGVNQRPEDKGMDHKIRAAKKQC